MKITDVKPHVVKMPDTMPWVFVSVETDEGVTGWGECTDYIANPQLVRGIEAVKPWVIGIDASHIEEIWQRIFHMYSDLNGRGFVSHLISAIDIALWDIKGKVLDRPIYDLLGGPVRASVPLYTHVNDTSQGDTFEDHLAGMMEDARRTKEMGFEAIKTDPFPSRRQYGKFRGAFMVERLDPAAIRDAVRWMDGLREAVGDDYELDGRRARTIRCRIRHRSMPSVGAHQPGVARRTHTRRKPQRAQTRPRKRQRPAMHRRASLHPLGLLADSQRSPGRLHHAGRRMVRRHQRDPTHRRDGRSSVRSRQSARRSWTYRHRRELPNVYDDPQPLPRRVCPPLVPDVRES